MTSHKETFKPVESSTALLERLRSYLPAGCTLDSPQYQQWVHRRLSKHREEVALVAKAQTGRMAPQEAAQLRILQTERQEYSAQMAARKGPPPTQTQPKPKLAVQPKPVPEDPAVTAAKWQVTAPSVGPSALIQTLLNPWLAHGSTSSWYFLHRLHELPPCSFV